MNSHQVASDPNGDELADTSNGRSSQTDRASQPLPAHRGSSEPSCFFRVIDVDTDGKNAQMQGECYSLPALVNFWATIPEQRANTIRVILHDQSNENAPFKFDMPQEKNPGYYSCTYDVYERPELPLWRTRDFHLPTLRRMLEKGSFAQWYSTTSIKKHRRFCRDPLYMERLWDVKYEQCRIYWAVDQQGIDDGKLVVVCHTPWPGLPYPNQCANAGWEWFQQVSTALNERRRYIRLTSGDPAQTLQLLILECLAVTLNQYGDFLDPLMKDVSDLPANNLEEHRIGVQIEYSQLRAAHVLNLREIEYLLGRLSESIECVSAQIKLACHYNDSVGNKSSASLAAALMGLEQESGFYTRELAGMREMIKDAHDVTAAFLSVQQADSVSRLTLLAAVFLPLSLAAGVLSMQTRFLDLHLLLYDLVGVIFILGSLAAVIGWVSKYGPDFYDNFSIQIYGWNAYHFPKLFRTIKTTVLVVWWLAFLASFLVGMLKDVLLGLRILGYSAAGIVGLWLLSMKGTRRGLDAREFSM